jgi:arylsulfatase A-like enzyme
MDRAMKPSPALAFLLLALLASSRASAADAARPNLLVFLTDDHGYGDLGCYGSPRVQTPHRDRLAAEGARCTQFYAPAPVCSPTRVGLLTERSPLRLGIYTYIPNHGAMHLQRTERTLPALLREGDWKIKATAEPATRFPSRMAWFKGAKLTEFELYNLREDLAEQHDLAAAQPAVLARLSAQVVRLYSEMQREAPDWGDAALPRSGEEAAAKKQRKK